MLAAFAGELKDLLGEQAEGLALEAPITKFPNFEHLEAAGRGAEQPHGTS